MVSYFSTLWNVIIKSPKILYLKPDGFHLHLLAPAYHPQYNLSYRVSSSRSPGFKSSSRWRNGVTATIGFDTVPPINFRILLCFTLDIVVTMKHTESRHASSEANSLFDHVMCFKWPTVELVALDHNRNSHGWKLLISASYKVPLLANMW